MITTVPTAQLGPVLATATWQPHYGDPASDERGRWIVETPSTGYLGVIAEPSTALVTVITRLRNLLEQDDVEVGDIAVLDGVVTAYRLDDADTDSQQAGTTSGVEAPTAVTTLGRLGDGGQAPGILTPVTDSVGGVVSPPPPTNPTKAQQIAARLHEIADQIAWAGDLIDPAHVSFYVSYGSARGAERTTTAIARIDELADMLNLPAAAGSNDSALYQYQSRARGPLNVEVYAYIDPPAARCACGAECTHGGAA